jgi:S-formylglutathione hydrolase FrmB
VKLSRRQLLGGLTALVGVGASAAGAYGLEQETTGDVTSTATPTTPGRLRAVAAATSGGSISRLVVTDPTGRRSPVLVWRPNGPDSADIPVVYLLHGVPGDAEGAAKTGVIQATAEVVRRKGRPLVLVIPDGTGHRADTEWADSTDRVDLVATRVIDSVIPAVEGQHRRPPRLRAIAGFSMGGYGAANLALHNPELFGQWVSLDGYFTIDDPDGVFADQDARNDNSPDRNVAAGADQRVLLIETPAEGKLVRGEAARMGDLLQQAGASVTIWTRPGKHSWAFVVSQWTPLLDWLGAGWSGRRPR